MKNYLIILLTTLYSFAFGQVVYQHDFGTTTITTHPYNVTPGTLNSNLNSSSWSNSTSAWTSFVGSSGQALSLSNSSGTPTVTLTFNVASGYALTVNSFSSWFRRSTTGAQNWAMSINGISVGSGAITTGGSNTGNIPVVNPVNNLVGTVTVVISLTGATGTGTFRVDDFTLQGTVNLFTPPTSRITPAQCGTSLVAMNQNLIGTWTSGATSYRFRIYDGVTFQTFDSPNYWTSISNFTTAFATSYTVDVAPTVGGTLYPYGIACSITTMTAPTSKLSPSQCGTTLVTSTQNLNGTHTSGATSYRFRIYDGLTYQTFDSPNYWTSISNFTVTPGTSYSVDIAPTVGGILYPYGVSCSITTFTPVTPTSSLISSQCGTTLVSTTQNLNGTHTSGATNYRFRIYDGITYQTFDSPNYWTNISNFTVSFGTAYAVDIAPTVGGILYPYGTSCSITTMTAPTSNLSPSQCGTTLVATNQNLIGTHTSSATNYRFRIYDGVTYQTFDSPTYWTSIANFTVTFGTTYTVDIAPTVGGIVYPYGSTCSITTMPAPSVIIPADCGSTVASAISYFHATTVVGAQEYDFRSFDGISYHSFNAGLADSARFFDFGTGNYMYNTTYSVDVRVKVAGVWTSFGPACNISTPNAPLTSLSPSQCGTTIIMNQFLIGQHVFGANGYRFRITDGVTTQIFDTSVYWININHFSTIPSTTYSVDVAPGINGTYYAYGTACSISTASAPTTQVIASQCGTTLGYMASNIIALHVSGATSYRFRITDGVSTFTYDTPNYWASFNNLSAITGTAYIVDVAPTVGGTMYPYGISCVVTSPGVPPASIEKNGKSTVLLTEKTLDQQASNFTFKTLAYPNPFMDFINLELTSDDTASPVSVKVYDATGRLIETREVNLNNETSIGLGMDYLQGVYQVHVIQNENSDIIRIVKN